MIIGKYASKALACVGGFIGGVRFSSNSNSTRIGKALLSSSVSFLNTAYLPSNEPTRADLRGDYLSVSSMPIQKVNSLKKWVRTLLPLGLLPILVACGGESDSGNSSEIWPENQVDQYVSVHAEDFYSVVQSTDSEEVRVNVVDKVARSGGERISLAEVEVLSSDPSCQLVDSDNESFQIISDHAMVCDYQYTVGLDGYSSGYQMIGKRSGVSRVVVANNAQQAELVPFGVAGYQGETLEIDIENELTKVGDNTSLSGFSLTDDVILMPTGSSSTVSLDKTNNKISYTPAATFKGNERILYTLENSSGNVLVGSAVVTVSERSSVGIDIPDKIVITDTVEVGKEKTISIVPYVIDKQDDNFQLIQVVAFDSAVALSDASDTTNKTFTFKVEHAGQYYVNAIVTDHRGGFDVALMKIVAINPNQTGLWGDYYYNNQIYSGPLTKSEADSGGIRNDGTYFDSAHSAKPAVAVFRQGNAAQYCGTFGRLPTKAELQAVWASDKGNSKNWPLSRGYIALDSSTYKVVSLSSGQELTDDGQGYYVTCVSNGALSIRAIDGTAVANGSDKAIVEATFLINGKAASGITVDASVSGRANLVKDSQVTDNSGKVRFEVTSTKAESVSISVDVGGTFSVSQTVTFIADVSTAVLRQISTSENNALADGIDQNQITALVVDKYFNSVPGVTVNFAATNSSTAKLKNTTGVTNASGNAVVNFTNTVAESVGIKATYKTIGLTSYARFVNDYSYGVLTIKTLTASAAANGSSKVSVEAEFKQHGSAAVGVDIKGVTTGSAKFVSSTVATGNDGKAKFELTNTKAESVNVTLSVGSFSRTVTLSFNADASSATITKIEIAKNNAVANNSATNQVNVVLADTNGNFVSNQTINFTVSNGSITSSTKTNASGVASVYVKNTKSQSVTVTARYGSSTRTANVTFIANTGTATVKSLSVLQDNASANGTEENQVRAQLADAYNNPLSNKTINFTVGGHAKVSQTTKTDGNGYANAWITNTSAQTVTVTAKFGTSSKTANVTFKGGDSFTVQGAVYIRLYETEALGGACNSQAPQTPTGSQASRMWVFNSVANLDVTEIKINTRKYYVPNSQGAVDAVCRGHAKNHFIHMRATNTNKVAFQFTNPTGALVLGNGFGYADPRFSAQCARTGVGTIDIKDGETGNVVATLRDINCQ
ncbi:Bacterial Ig-like domain family protein [Vibrio jasicida]|uniref:Ig-like domain-containing protein n=1 Tax=Vibrio jasicida TaxID=766224 RepID=UPI002894E80E|nr:Bacterial Ig-like domain family protein [Vibrio jasicida]